MTTFWASLMQVNARKVMWILLPCCQVVLLICLWRLSQTDTGLPLMNTPILSTDSYTPTNRFPPVPPPSAGADLASDLFNSQYILSLLEQQRHVEREKIEASRRAQEAATLAEAAQSPNPSPVDAPVQTEPSVSPRKVVALTYRGMITRPDGRRLALIKNDADGSEQFFAVESKIVGHRLHRIERLHMSLADDTNAILRLELGQAVEVEIP